MKLKLFILSFIDLLLLLTGAGCKKEESLETDPAKIILGKWEMVEMCDEPVESPSAYTEYLPDSVFYEYEYATDEYYYKKYCIDTLLHEYIYVPQKECYILLFEYSYDFTDNNNKMYLHYTNFIAMCNSFTFKRIE